MSLPSSSLSAYQFLAAEIIQEVKSKKCMSLEYEKLAAMLELVIDNQEVMDILRKTHVTDQEIQENTVCFDTVYRNHYIKREHNFKLMTFMHSFALSWLFYLYH